MKLKKKTFKKRRVCFFKKKTDPQTSAPSARKFPAEAAASGAYCIRIPDAHALRFARLFAFRCVRHRIRNRGIQGLTCIVFFLLLLLRKNT